MSFQKFDLEHWARKQHFEFFKELDMPFFNITATLDITKFQKQTSNYPFSLVLLHSILKVVNSIDEFKLRVVQNELVQYDKINVGTTIDYEHHTFLYAFLEYFEDVNEFVQKSEQSITLVKKEGILKPNSRPDVVYFTSIPWIHYTHISHAKNTGKDDFIPRVAVGKYLTENNKTTLPVSMEVNHCLCDGYHVGLFFEKLQKELDTKLL